MRVLSFCNISFKFLRRAVSYVRRSREKAKAAIIHLTAARSFGWYYCFTAEQEVICKSGRKTRERIGK